MSTINPLLWLNNDQLAINLANFKTLPAGYNQNPDANLIHAPSDEVVVQNFLMRYHDSPQTFVSYIKVIERLLLWCHHQQHISLSALSYEHLRDFRLFLKNPTPKAQWCGTPTAKLTKQGEFNPAWRPFAGGLTESSIRHAFSVIDRFLNYLVEIRYLLANPLSVDKRRKKNNTAQRMERWLERDEINETLSALDGCDKARDYDAFHALRAKYIILTLFYTGLRRAELANHAMGNFLIKNDEWYLKVIGKGEKPRTIAVPDEYKDILIQFRQSIGLPAFPTFEEETPLVPASDHASPITPRRISQILKWAFALGAERFEMSATDGDTDDNIKRKHKASRLRAASAHWLRHSYGTYLVKSGCPVEKVQKLMGHADISTTMIYVHIAQDDLHLVARDLSIQPRT